MLSFIFERFDEAVDENFVVVDNDCILYSDYNY
jgi:hypothetical protein